MEANPMAIALVGVIGGLLIGMISLLIAMVVGLKRDYVGTSEKLFTLIAEIQQRLTHMVLYEDYKDDKKEITLKLDEHGDRILRLEIYVKEVPR
jgi:Na+-translocating ferredoxin:NAD+ oxidoreductase RnfG subunit